MIAVLLEPILAVAVVDAVKYPKWMPTYREYKSTRANLPSPAPSGVEGQCDIVDTSSETGGQSAGVGASSGDDAGYQAKIAGLEAMIASQNSRPTGKNASHGEALLDCVDTLVLHQSVGSSTHAAGYQSHTSSPVTFKSQQSHTSTESTTQVSNGSTSIFTNSQEVKVTNEATFNDFDDILAQVKDCVNLHRQKQN